MNQMKHLLTAIACCLAVAGSAQSDAYPFNPDSEGDGIVGVADLLALLSDFGLEAEVETCFRGEIYECSGQMDAWSAQYLPNDCGIVRAHRNGFRRVRLPVAANEGDVLYAITVQSTYVNASLIYQTLIGDQWQTILSYGYYDSGTDYDKFVYNGTHWVWEPYNLVGIPIEPF